MPVVPLTLTISLTLVFSFVIFFLREHARGRISSSERDSLLPLAEEDSRLAGLAGPLAAARHDAEGHGERDGCGCRDGSQAPCAGCRRRE
ncbi:MAG: hypothetical protein RIQ93_1898 [Verrucomicrobiota bacterium]|jgi:hypothetical protein